MGVPSTFRALLYVSTGVVAAVSCPDAGIPARNEEHAQELFLSRVGEGEDFEAFKDAEADRRGDSVAGSVDIDGDIEDDGDERPLRRIGRYYLWDLWRENQELKQKWWQKAKRLLPFSSKMATGAYGVKYRIPSTGTRE